MQVNSLQFENDALKKRVLELENLKDRSDLEEYMKNNRVWYNCTLNLLVHVFSFGACLLTQR